MKVIYVIDNISDLNNKINLITHHFGNNIFFVVKADLVELFETYNYVPHAVYYKNLTKVIHTLLANSEIDDIIICYSSLMFNEHLLTKLTNAIGNRTKIVNLMPKYTSFENMCNSAYNIYVKSLFKVTDSMISPKFQFIPSNFLPELLSTHLGNRLFEINSDCCKNVTIEDEEINKSMKIKAPILKNTLIACIIALLITVGLLASIAYYKVNYLIILSCVVLYILDLILTFIFSFKAKFDHRFLK